MLHIKICILGFEHVSSTDYVKTKNLHFEKYLLNLKMTVVLYINKPML